MLCFRRSTSIKNGKCRSHISRFWSPVLSASLGERHRRIEHAVREAPLVVVPGRDLDQTPGDFGQRRIEGARRRIVVEVAGDQRRFAVVQHAFQCGGIGSLLHDRVDLGYRRVARGVEAEIDDRDIDRRHSDREAVETAVEFRQHQANSSGSAGLGRNHVVAGGAGAAQILVIDVGQDLVIREGVDRRHQAVDDADLRVQRLRQRRQAVGCARGIRDHRHARFQCLVIDAVDDRRVDIRAAGRRNHHLPGAAGDVCRSLGLRGEEAGAFEHDVDPEFAPGQLRRIAVREHLDPVAIDHEVFAIDRDRARKRAVRCVVPGQVGIGIRRAEIVDRDDLDILAAAFIQRAQHVAADAAVAVDANLDCSSLTNHE